MRTERSYDSSYNPTTAGGHGAGTTAAAASVQETTRVDQEASHQTLQAELEEALGQLDFRVAPSSQSVPQTAAAARRAGRGLSRLPAQEIQGRAQRLVSTLEQNQGSSRAQTATRRAALNSLVALYDAMDQRVTNAPLSENGLPSMEGIAWDADSPLAGSTMDLPPFGERDSWRHQLAVMQPRRRPTLNPVEPTPHPVDPPSPEVPPELPPVEVDTSDVHLEDSEGGFLNGAWTTGLSIAGESGSLAAGLTAFSGAVVAEVLLTFGGSVLNMLSLGDAWVNADSHGRAAGQARGMLLALHSLRSPHGLANDGRVSVDEVMRRVLMDEPEALNSQVQYGGVALRRIAPEAFRAGVALVANVLDRVMELRTQQLDDAGITDPVQRQHELDVAFVTTTQTLEADYGSRLAQILRHVREN